MISRYAKIKTMENGESKNRGRGTKEKVRSFVTHTFPPLYAPDSEILILGSIPSPKSREIGFYYGHPRNRFWSVLARVLDEPVPATVDIDAKKAICLRHHIALWDVLASCYIHGADDGSIEEPVANDIAGLILKTGIRHIFTTGTKAYQLYRKYCEAETGIEAVRLPSTSPANCAVKEEMLLSAYGQLANVLKKKIIDGNKKLDRNTLSC